MELSLKTIRDYDEADRIREAFQAKLDNGSAIVEDVVQHIPTINQAGYETIPYSMGMELIHHNPSDFARIVGDVNVFLERILELAEVDLSRPRDAEPGSPDVAHSLHYWFMNSFLLSRKLMALLSPEWRNRYIREIFPRFSAMNYSWISAAILNCVSRQTIASAIIERLGRTIVRDGVTNDVNDFLRYGAGNDNPPIHTALRSLGVTSAEMDKLGLANITADPSIGFAVIEQRLLERIDPDKQEHKRFPDISPWFVLSNEELAVAFMICAETHPEDTLNAMDHHHFEARPWNPSAKATIVRKALQNMTSLSGVSLENLMRLTSAEDRIAIARRLKPVDKHFLHKVTAQFLFKVLCNMSGDARQPFWSEVIVPVLKLVAASTLYCVWRQLGFQEAKVEATLRDWLDKEGYLLGTISKGVNPRGGTQLEVCLCGHHFVHFRNQHRYYPHEGDLVLFHIPTSRRIAHNATAVHFTPVMKDAD
ncbi:hypothetical protein HY771_00765 [Candidatus Uhrbacteria bacterium]|nr:hypothetical protein [Candidatus Uhrbacteria bacterium]